MVVVFISGGSGFGAIVSSGAPEFRGSVAMTVAPTLRLRFGGPLMTFSYLLVQFRCSIIRIRAIARWFLHVTTITGQSRLVRAWR